jgi:hypothetical protein
MAYELKDNSGSLFRNEKKETDKHPNATGTVMVGGVEYWISAWTKDGAKGKFQSLAFKPKEPPRAPASTVSKMMDSYDDKKPYELDDEIPF